MNLGRVDIEGKTGEKEWGSETMCAKCFDDSVDKVVDLHQG